MSDELWLMSDEWLMKMCDEWWVIIDEWKVINDM